MAYDFSPVEKKIADAREWLENEFRGIRTGRATPTLLDAVQVNAYGSRVPLKQTANIAVEDARTLRIAPYDPSVAKEIEKAISSADLGVGLVTDAGGLRVTFPELTSERRQELLKIAKNKLEEARTTIRLARDEVWNDIQKQEREGEMTEDDKFFFKDELQRKVDSANEMLEKLYEQKEKEITS